VTASVAARADEVWKVYGEGEARVTALRGVSVFGALLGVVVGAGLGTAVVRALDGDGITELVLPWPRMGLYLLLAAVVGVIAAAAPAIRAARLNVLGAIAHE
jgi:putative ABC transport system permease protein